jgi:hypothetical protein
MIDGRRRAGDGMGWEEGSRWVCPSVLDCRKGMHCAVGCRIWDVKHRKEKAKGENQTQKEDERTQGRANLVHIVAVAVAVVVVVVIVVAAAVAPIGRK